MPRFKRVVIPGLPYHVVQRASHQRFILDDANSRAVFMKALVKWQLRTGMMIASFVLMGNHFHLVGVSPSPTALPDFMGRACAEFSRYCNMNAGRQGPNWEGRYFTSPMDDAHTLDAIRYIERNPVAAQLVDVAWEWPWSSAAFHAGMGPRPQLLNLDLRPKGTTPQQWREALLRANTDDFRSRFKLATSSGRALGQADWAAAIDRTTGRSERKVGRPLLAETFVRRPMPP